MKNFILLSLLFIISKNNLLAQDPIFDQYLFTRTHINPGVAGTDSTLIVSLGNNGDYFNNKNEMDNNTFHFSVDQYVHFLRGGIGLNVISENQSTFFKGNSISFSYAPHIEVFNHKLAIQPGISIGYTQKKADWEEFYNNNPFFCGGPTWCYHASTPLNEKRYFDYAAGIFLYTKQFYGGFSVKHITQPDEGLLNRALLRRLITFNTGFNLKKNIDSKFIFSPKFIYQYQGGHEEFKLGLTAKLNWILLGVEGNYESGIFQAGVQTKHYRIGYSLRIDVNSHNYHEIQLSGFIPYKHKNKGRKTIRLI